MKLIKQLSLLAIVALSFVACKKKDAAGDAADAMCTCAKPMTALTKEMEGMKDKPDEMMKRMGEFDKVGKEFQACIKTIEEKYKDKKDDKAFEEAVKTAMETKCKDVTDAMSKASGNQAEEAPAPAAH